MEMIPVRSSAISAVGYNPDTQQLRIKFKDGGTYNFCRVPPSIADGFLTSSSKGSYYDRHIRGKYHC